MSIEENKAIVKRYAEDPWNTGNVAVLDETVGDNWVHPPHEVTLDQFKEQIRMCRQAFPDLTNTVEELIAEGDKVAFRWTMRGTHHGEIEGVAPTGKQVTFTGITIVRLANGKIVEDRYESGSPGLQQQLGVALESPGKLTNCDPART